MSRLRLGTRGSPLARAQAEWAAQRLKQAHPALDVELVVIKTSGDGFIGAGSPVPNIQIAAPNVKAMFVKEIEEALLRKEIDFGVHSAKDLPGSLPSGLILAAYPPREDPRDAFVPGSSPCWDALPAGAALGASSLRRQAQARLKRPDLRFEPVRGNVDTRLRKMREGGWAGLILAEAGLKRLGLDSVPREILPLELMVPAPGQGALALEAREDRKDVLEILAAADDERSRLEVSLERAFLNLMCGGCSTPLGALARLQKPSGSGERSSSSSRTSPQALSKAGGGERASMALTVFWAAADRSRAVRLSGRSGLGAEELGSLIDSFRGRIAAA